VWKRALAALLLGLGVVFAVWTSLVVSYESDLGTDNSIEATFAQTGTNETDDALATLAFAPGSENLTWSSLDIAVLIEGERHACGFGSQSLPAANGVLVEPRLGADGLTFTTAVDATDEEVFTHFSLPHQRHGDAENFTLRFSTTDIYMADGVQWSYLSGATFGDVQTTADVVFSNDTTQRLEWYEYDLAVHRVTPNKGVYLFQVDQQTYKVQFLSYYDENDESRHPTMMIGALENSSFPALNDPELVSPSPCLIVAGDDDLSYWNANETIHLVEQNIDIRSQNETIELDIRYEGKDVRIVENPPVSTEA